MLSSSDILFGSMRWCVVIISNQSTYEIYLIIKNEHFFLSIRYTRFLIKYHLFIFGSILIMTSVSIGLLIYKHDQIHFGNLLRVKKEMNKNLILKVYVFSLIRVFKHMEQNHQMNIEN